MFLFVLLLDGFGVAGGEQACFAPQLAFPPGRIGGIQDLDDIAGGELQLVCLLGMETVKSSDLQCGGSCVLAMEEMNIQGQTLTHTYSKQPQSLKQVSAIDLSQDD